MNISIITIFPTLFDDFFKLGVIGRAALEGQIKVNIIDLRDFTTDNYNQVDDRPYGGGAGMILMPEPLSKAIESVKTENSKVIFLTPSGQRFDQSFAENLSKEEDLIFICGRYEGIDQRIIDMYVDIEISIGDYVLSGGEIPAMAIIDAVGRLIPGVIRNEDFNKNESFSNPVDRTELDFPQYTRPADFRGLKVPSVLLSGNHKNIEEWRKDKIRHK